eukprot:6213616-Pleurochrysis_carterae.AAC.2
MNGCVSAVASAGSSRWPCRGEGRADASARGTISARAARWCAGASRCSPSGPGRAHGRASCCAAA